MTSRTIFHIDMDAFFASIEQRDTPSYRGKPLVVGARPGTRGVVSAASYEARKYGVRSAMPISEAVRRCPKGIFVEPRMETYERDSHTVMRILDSFSPSIEQVSIDEAFIDMTGTERLFGDPQTAARRIVEHIGREIALTASIGIAPNKFLAKIASDLNKPSGITLAPFGEKEIIAWLAPMPVGRIWGIGKKTGEILSHCGILSIGDLQHCAIEFLVERFGRQGEALFALSRGLDERPVGEGGEAKSISREHTFNEDSYCPDAWKEELFSMSQDVARTCRRKGIKGHTVVLTYRQIDFSRHTKRQSLAYPTNVAKFIYDAGLALLKRIDEPALRLIGIGLTGLEGELQTELFGQEGSAVALEAAEAAADRIVDRFGDTVLRKGREIRIHFRG